ncbi:hypothetical protein QBC35DRAFT_384506 [Podospora australis]|uniref:F-box domain-containing protein n=1 Tax=Podospora australis TaxID=1536484 RepID=A0AAN6WT33_9PEZI|nr:hypothetical protein QBC35DRAFT_384506 [Podospora australis]
MVARPYISSTSISTLIPERPLILRYLPNEIWLWIFDYLPHRFFQEDIGRLTLSKRWYSLAYPVFSSRIQCTLSVIGRILRFPRDKEPFPQSLAILRQGSVDIALEGFEIFESMYLAVDCLSTFSGVLREWAELKKLTFRVGWDDPAVNLYPSVNRFSFRGIEPFILYLDNLTHLDLDLCATTVTGRTKYSYSKLHFCLHLRPLLSRLESLRLRTRCICQFALRPILRKRVTVKELTVNLYLGNVSDENPKLNMTRLCSGWVNPIDHMQAEMKRLLLRMKSPRVVELVHLAPNGEIHVWDALKRTCEINRSEPKRIFSSPMVWSELLDGKKKCFKGDEWQITRDFEIDGLMDTDTEGRDAEYESDWELDAR